MATDGVVTIQANLNAKDAEKELNRLNQHIQKLQAELDKKASSTNALELEFRGATEAAKETDAELKSLQAELKKCQSLQGFTFEDDVSKFGGNHAAMALYNDKMFTASYEAGEKIPQLLEQIKQKEKELANDEALANKLGEKYDKAVEEVDALGFSIDETKEKAVAMEQQIAKENSGFKKLKTSAVNLASELTILKTVFSAIKGVAQAVVKVFKKLGDLCKTIFKWGSKVAKTLWTMFGAIGNDNGEGFAEALKNIKQIIKSLFGVRNLYSLIRKLESAITECFEDLAQYSDDINEAISSVTSAFSQFKYAVTSAIAPLVTTFAPAISQLLQLCASAANELARITAMLTGQTSYTKANYVWEDYAESLEDASDASDKFLASFDTLEKIGSSSSSDSSSSSISEMFETVEVTPFDFSSWGEALDTFLDWLNDTAIPKIESALTTGVDWINNLFGNLSEMFTYTESNGVSVSEKAYEFGQNLAEKLNDAISNINWSNIGTTIGAGLNVALNAAIGFIYTFNWYAFGNDLADAINSMISSIEWDKVGRWLWNKFLIAIEFLAGLITGGDTGAWAEAASDIIIAFYTDMANTINDQPWETIGQKIREFVEGIKWVEIGYAMQGGIQAAFNAIEKADLAGTLGSLLANIFNWAMSTLLGSDIEDQLADEAQGLLDGTLTLKDLTSQEELESSQNNGLISQITSFVERFIEVFKEEFDTDKWEEVSEQLEESFDKVLNWAFEFIVPLVLDIAGKFASAFWKEVNERMSEGAETWRTNLFTKMFGEETGYEMNETIKTFTKGVDYNPFESSGGSAGEGFNEGVESAVEDGASETASGVASAMTAALKSALGIHSPSALIGDEVGEPSGQGLLDYFADLFTDLSTWAKEKVADPLVNSIKDTDMFSTDTWKSFGETAMSGLIDAFESGFNSIISGLNNLMSQVSSAVSQMSSMMSTVTGTSGLVLSTATYSRLNSISLPALAEGAVIPPNREFLAVLGDQKTGTNIETPLNTMVEAFKQAMRDSDFGGGNMTTVLEVDGVTLGSVVYNMNKKESQRIGTNLVTNR